MYDHYSINLTGYLLCLYWKVFSWADFVTLLQTIAITLLL